MGWSSTAGHETSLVIWFIWWNSVQCFSAICMCISILSRDEVLEVILHVKRIEYAILVLKPLVYLAHLSWKGKGIQVCSNEGEHPSPRGDNSKKVKIRYTEHFLKIFFSRTSKPISIKLDTNYPWVKEIQNCTNKAAGPLQRGDNHKNVKMGWGHLKIFGWRTTEPEELIFIWKLSDIM
jgi:hypothetical protein